MNPLSPVFFDAVRAGDLQQVNGLLGVDASLAHVVDDTKGMTALCVAASQGDLAMVQSLLDHGSPLETEPSPLVLAFAASEPAMADLLINRGAIPHPHYQLDGRNWFKTLCERGPVSRVSMVLDRLSPTAPETDFLHGEGFQAAVESGNLEVLDQFHDQGATAAQMERWLFRGGRVSLSMGQAKLSVLDRLLGWGVWGSQAEKVSAFTRSMAPDYCDWREVLEVFLRQGLEIDQPDGSLGVLHKLCAWGRLDIIQEVVRRGARVNHKDEAGNTPLAWACLGREDAPVVEWLLARGADVHAISGYQEQGMGVMHHAAKSGSIKTLALLLDAGANINDQDRNGDTPLHYAASRACWSSSKEAHLLSWMAARGADPCMKNHKGYMPGQLSGDQPATAHELAVAAQCDALRLSLSTAQNPNPARVRRERRL